MVLAVVLVILSKCNFVPPHFVLEILCAVALIIMSLCNNNKIHILSYKCLPYAIVVFFLYQPR